MAELRQIFEVRAAFAKLIGSKNSITHSMPSSVPISV